MNNRIEFSKLPKMQSPMDHANSRDAEHTLVNDLDGFGDAICSLNGWSPSVFKDNVRNNENFLYTQIIGLDIDSGISLSEAINLFKEYKHLIATTKNHQKEKNGQPACDRFRVILFLTEPITNIESYYSTWFELFTKYPFIDKACKDPARFYSKSSTVVSVNKDGQTINVIVSAKKQSMLPKTIVDVAKSFSGKGRLSVNTKKFISEGKPAGEWQSALFKAAIDLKEQNYTQEEAISLLSTMTNQYFTGSLDAKDMKTIQSAYRRVIKYPPRIEFPVMVTNFRGETYPDEDHPENMKYLITSIMKYEPKLNQLKNKIYIDNKPSSDFQISLIRNKCREFKISSAKDNVLDVLWEMAAGNSYHPFKEAIESVKYDGEDHIERLFKTISFDSADKNLDLYKEYLKRWLIGVVAKVYETKGAQNLVMVLQGGQGLGKSRWIGKFNIADGVYSEGSINPDDKDHKLRHFNYVLWHASELDGITRKRDHAALKDFFTMQDLAIREPYGRFDREGISRLSFCASVNEESFLNDLTGNRRFLILPITGIDADHSVDMLQVFAQAFTLYKNGSSWWFDQNEIKTINEINEQYVHQNNVDLLASKVEPGKTWVSAQEIFENFGNSKYHSGDLSKLGSLLKKKGIESARKTVNGVKMTLYKIKSNKFEHDYKFL